MQGAEGIKGDEMSWAAASQVRKIYAKESRSKNDVKPTRGLSAAE